MIVSTRGGFNHHVGSGGHGLMYESGPFLSPSYTDSRGPIGMIGVAAAVRLVAETIGSFVMRAYTGDATRRQPLLDAPQAALLQDGSEDFTSMDLWSDVATGLELHGNGLIWKSRLKVGGAVAELLPFPVDVARICARDDGSKLIEIVVGGERVDITKDVIHIRGWSPCTGLGGKSTIDLHRTALRGSEALELYRGRYFETDATPNLVLIHPGQPNPEQRAALRQSWNARHAGPNGEKTGVLWDGMTVQQLASSLRDAQVAELMTWDLLQIARMFRIFPAALLSTEIDDSLPGAEQIADLFYRFSLMHRLRRIERAISRDRDVFPDRKVYARFDVWELVRGDIATLTAMVHQLKQVGMITANEGRSYVGLPPSTDPAADKLLETPVGAAPNSGDGASGDAAAPGASDATASTPAASKSARALSAAEVLQKVYLAVGKVITIEEARAIANQSGAGLAAGVPAELAPDDAAAPAPPPAPPQPDGDHPAEEG